MNSGRVRAFDWLKGLAVLVMVQTHTRVLLSPELKGSGVFHWLDFIDGLVAPSFLFASGFSIALVGVRAAQANQRAARIRKTSFRLLEVLAVACLLNWMWYPLLKEPIWLFRLDILHCVGLTLLCALPLVAWLSPRPWLLSVVMAVIAVAIFSVAPLLELTDGFFARFVTEKSVSIFPLVPWAAYVFVGACIGSIAAGYGSRKLLAALVVLAAVCFGLWKLTPLLSRPYPPHELWRTGPGPHAYRIFWVALLALGLRLIEARVQAKNRVVQFIEKFGTSSLSAYFFHLTFLYYELIPRVSYRAQFEGSLAWPGYVVATLSLIALTFFAVVGYERAEQWLFATVAKQRASAGQLAGS